MDQCYDSSNLFLSIVWATVVVTIIAWSEFESIVNTIEFFVDIVGVPVGLSFSLIPWWVNTFTISTVLDSVKPLFSHYWNWISCWIELNWVNCSMKQENKGLRVEFQKLPIFYTSFSKFKHQKLTCRENWHLIVIR